MYIRTSLTILFLSVLKCAAQNQDTIQLDLFTVQAVRITDSSLHILRPDLKLNQEELDHAPVQSTQDALNMGTGIDVRSRGAMGVQSDLSIRGGSFDQSLVMIDGIKLSDPQTGHHMMDLPLRPEDIQSVEQINHGGSRWFGPYAFSGAVNLITRRAENSGLRINLSGGEFGYLENGASASYVNKFSATTISAEQRQSDGYQLNTDFNRNYVSLRSNVDIGKAEIKLIAAQTEKNFGALNFYTSAYPLQYEETRTQLGGIQAGIPIGKVIITPRFYFRRHYDRFELYRTTGNYYNNIQGFQVYEDDTIPSWYTNHNFHRTDVIGEELNVTFRTVAGQTSIGTEQRLEYIWSNNLGEPSDTVEGPNGATYNKSAERSNASIFIEHNVKIWRFAISAGLLYNSNSDFGTGIYPGIDLAFKLAKKVNLLAGANRSVRFPTYTDLYYNQGGAVGSINLQPEYADNYQAGFSYKQKRMNTTVMAFQRHASNLIDWIRYNGSTTTQAANLTEVVFSGIEGSVKFDFMQMVPEEVIESVTIRGTYMQADAGSEGFESNYVLDYLNYKLYFGMDQRLSERLSLTWMVRWQDRVGGYVPAGQTEEVAFDPFAICDMRLRQSGKIFTWYAEISNLFNTTYQDIGNIIQPGRWVRAGVTCQLDFTSKSANP